MRYRDGLPLVLDDITFEIRTCEKVGIVGRTGSGKSSLGVLLWRLVEPEQGSMHIDDVDIRQIGLYNSYKPYYGCLKWLFVLGKRKNALLFLD